MAASPSGGGDLRMRRGLPHGTERSAGPCRRVPATHGRHCFRCAGLACRTGGKPTLSRGYLGLRHVRSSADGSRCGIRRRVRIIGQNHCPSEPRQSRISVRRRTLPSAAITESTVQWLLHRRMNAQQQMRWSPRGAHLMLKVRTSVVNGTLDRDHAVAERWARRPFRWAA